MKKNWLLLLTVLTLGVPAAQSFADDAKAVGKRDDVKAAESTHHATALFSGSISTVNFKERTLTVKKGFISRTFNLAEDCSVVVEDKHNPSVSDLHTGHRVEVSYESVSGVLVAHRVAQENNSFTGTITAVDREQKQVTITTTWAKKAFKITPDSKVVLRDNKSGNLDDLKIGHKVNLTYEQDNKIMNVVRLEQKSLNFDGVVKAVDTSERTLKAKVLLSEKKFSLASNCSIVVDGKLGAKLSDLRLGQSIDIDYEEVGGVNVALRISQSSSAPAETSKTAATAAPTVTP